LDEPIEMSGEQENVVVHDPSPMCQYLWRWGWKRPPGAGQFWLATLFAIVTRLATAPDRFFVGLLAVQVFVLLSQRFQWFAFNEKKGWTVLIAVGAVGLAVLVMLVWFGACLLVRRRFQFSFRSLLLFVVVVSAPLGWFAWEMGKARRQREAVEAIGKAGGEVYFDCQRDEWRGRIRGGAPTTPAWLRKLLGDDFFRNVVLVNGGFGVFGDNDARHLQELMNVEPHWTWTLNGGELELSRAVIESEFGSQLSLIKSRSVELDESDREGADRIRKKLQVALSIPEVFEASWGGHHGLQGLVSAGAEEWCYYSTGVISRSPDGLHTLYFGESNDGVKLSVFEGIVPNGTKRVFTIAFRYDQIVAKQTP